MSRYDPKEPSVSQRSFFTRFAHAVSSWAGKPVTFLGACLVIVVWSVTGPLFSFSDTWQLVINTGTTIITFLMVFLIQNTQNRDTSALQLKLDELIVSMRTASNDVIDIEELDEKDLLRIHGEILERAKRAGRDVSKMESESRAAAKKGLKK